MAESTLAAAFKDLQGDIGFFLGMGRGADNGQTTWTSEQQLAIDRCTRGGLRNVYFCGHAWSFLQPISTMTLEAGENTVTLPDDFGGTDGQLQVSLSSGLTWWPLDFTGIGHILRQEAMYPSTTGLPQMVAEEPLKGTGSVTGQRFRLHFWPLADQDYTLQFPYHILPSYLSGALPYVYGGAKHAETFLESCLAVAEKLLDDAATLHATEFEKRLAISISLDARDKPQLVGYNADRSDGRFEWSRRDVHWNNPVTTFHGVTPG